MTKSLKFLNMYGEYTQVHFVVLLYIYLKVFIIQVTKQLYCERKQTVASGKCRSRKFGGFFNDFFTEKFLIHNKIKKKVQRFSKYTYPLTCIASPIFNTPPAPLPHCQSNAFVTSDKRTMTYHKCPKSIVYRSVHFWCCTFCRCGQVYDMSIIISYGVCRISPMCSLSIPHHPCPTMETPDLFTASIVLLWNSIVCSLFRLASST